MQVRRLLKSGVQRTSGKQAVSSPQHEFPIRFLGARIVNEALMLSDSGNENHLENIEQLIASYRQFNNKEQCSGYDA